MTYFWGHKELYPQNWIFFGPFHSRRETNEAQSTKFLGGLPFCNLNVVLMHFLRPLVLLVWKEDAVHTEPISAQKNLLIPTQFSFQNSVKRELVSTKFSTFKFTLGPVCVLHPNLASIMSQRWRLIDYSKRACRSIKIVWAFIFRFARIYFCAFKGVCTLCSVHKHIFFFFCIKS